MARLPPTTNEGPPQGAPDADGGVGGAAQKLSTLVAIVALCVLATLANALSARTFRRWDFTKGGLFTLGPATVDTLRALEEPIEVWVLSPAGDPLTLSLRHVLDAYRSVSPRLSARYIDPDTQPAEVLALQQRFRMAPSPARVLGDVRVVVARGDEPHFLTENDLVLVEDAEDMRVRPRIEYSLTLAIRTLLAGERTRLCVATGGPEGLLDRGGELGLAALRERLVRNNYEVVELPRKRDLGSGQRDPIGDCQLFVVVPVEPFAPDDVARLAAAVSEGKSALVAASAIPTDAELTSPGIDGLLRLAGVRLEKDLVIERDPGFRAAQGSGEILVPKVETHPVTERVSDPGTAPASVLLASSLTLLSEANVTTVPLLATSEKAFALTAFGELVKGGEPKPASTDRRGPLVVAAAAERAPTAGKQKGARLVVIAAQSSVAGMVFQERDLAGTATLVSNAITWLSSRQTLLDIPDKPASATRLSFSEESIAQVFRYVVLYMPLAMGLFGAAVFLRRRSTEKRAPSPSKPARSDRPTDAPESAEDDE